MQKIRIRQLRGREILDSRGNPTVEAEITLSNDVRAVAAVPSGASTGRREAVERRDNAQRYGGKGVQQAVHHINTVIADGLREQDAGDQAAIDRRLIELDGSDNKANLGANALLAVSLAACKAAAQAASLPLYRSIGGDAATCLPLPLMNIINGGAHASNNLDIQEFMIVPHGFADFAEALRAGTEIFHALRGILAEANMSLAVGDEGGFAPMVNGTEDALDLLCKAVERSDYQLGEQIGIALDCAAGEFYRDERYQLTADNFDGDAAAFVAVLERWTANYPIVSIEDGCDEDDREGWRLLSERLGDKIQLVGDDLFVTNPAIVRRGIADGIANALLVKPNQIGTVSETVEATQLAQAANYQTIMSHRSGETEYADIADLAVGLNCRQIKTGAPCRGERVAKYNQLLRIADELGDTARFARPLSEQRP